MRNQTPLDGSTGDEPTERSREPEDVEPRIDPDSQERLAEELPEAPYPASRYDAGTGQGTVSGPPYGEELQERPILDGSTQDRVAEASVPNPYRGQEDPALVHRQPALNTSSTSRWMIASAVAAVVVTIPLLLLSPWNPLWCGIGIFIALIGLLAMLVVRSTGLRTKTRLRLDAALMAMIWLVPLAILLVVLFTSIDRIV